MRDGRNVFITDALNEGLLYEIKYFRAPSTDELRQMQASGAVQVDQLLQMYYPILHTKERQDADGAQFSILLIDKGGEKVEPEIATNVFNGIEIDTRPDPFDNDNNDDNNSGGNSGNPN